MMMMIMRVIIRIIIIIIIVLFIIMITTRGWNGPGAKTFDSLQGANFDRFKLWM